MRYELTDDEWSAIRPTRPNKPRGVPRADDRTVLNGIFSFAPAMPETGDENAVRDTQAKVSQVRCGTRSDDD